MRKFFLLFIVLLVLLPGCRKAAEYSEETGEMLQSSLQADPYANAPLQVFAIRAYRFAFDPNTIEVQEGDHVRITITSLDVGHGFALPDFGINEKVPPEGSVTVDFLADKSGEFGFFSSVYSGKDYKNMTGKLVVKESQKDYPPKDSSS